MTINSDGGPLSGVRVIDLTTVVMGPMSSRILGDLGADVIRVDAPQVDLIRDFAPQRSPGMSGITLNLQRNKRSVLLDLKTDAGKRAMYDLIATSNAFVTNLRASALASLGLSPEDLVSVRPDLVYCGAVGYSSEGPYAGRAAYDDVIQAVSGMASMFDWMGPEPAFVPSIMADKIAALHIAYATAAGLYRQASTGHGDVIEVPMAEALASFNLVEHLNGHTFEPREEPFSYLRLRTPNRKPRRTADGWICVLPYSNANYRDFFAHAGRPELADDERFSSTNARVHNAHELYGLIEELVPMFTTAEWMQFCATASIPCAPVTDLGELGDNEHFAAVGLLELQEHPTEGAYRVIKDPVVYRSGDGVTVREPAPRPGQHTASIMSELGWTDDEIAELG